MNEEQNFDNSNVLDIQALFVLLVRNAKVLLLFLSVGVMVGILIVTFATPYYRVDTVLLPVSEDTGGMLSALGSQFAGLASIGGIGLGSSGSQTQQAIAVLQSKGLTRKFIESNQLLPVLFDDRWDSARMKWKKSMLAKDPTVWDGIKEFDEKIRYISEDARTGLVTLSITWKDPAQAAEWATFLVDAANEAMRNSAISDTEKTIAFLNAELQKDTSVEVSQAIYQALESQIKAAMFAKSKDQYALKIVDPPAIPDMDDFDYPNVKGIILLSGIFGFLCGFMFVVARSNRK